MSYDSWAFDKLRKVLKYVDIPLQYRFVHQGVIIDSAVLIAKKRTVFRPVGKLNWAWYTAKGLGTALNEGRELEYYEEMLKDARSPSNEWKDKEKEQRLRLKYEYEQHKRINSNEDR